MENVEERVKQVIAEQMGHDEVVDVTRILEDLDADSLNLVELVMAIEEEFEYEFSDDEVEEVERNHEEQGDTTVEEIVKYITRFFGE